MSDIGSVQGAHYSNFSQPSENLYESSLPDPSWFVDFGATNHITSNLNNLSLHAPYNSVDKMSVGNGKLLYISNIGLRPLYTQTNPTSTISLPNVLHV